jgi:glycosyltransferase involved in cell wall biosynthesis
VALFHPAFHGIGGAEILVATQARYLEKAGFDVRVVTMAFDEAVWAPRFAGLDVRVVSKPFFLESLSSKVARLKRVVPRAERQLSDCRVVMAANAPCNALLGASKIPGRRVWGCTEPSRELHLAGTNPRIHARVASGEGGTSAVERDYARRLHADARMRASRSGAELLAFDIESTRKLDAIYAISEFSRDSVRRVYERTDTEIICPIVRFPAHRGARKAGLDRTGLRVLSHTRLELPKNVENVLRGFSLFLARHPGATLDIVGEGAERRALERLAAELALSSAAVRFHGYLPDAELERVYASCDVFALQPLDEPFGMVFPEAAARGLILVGPDHGGPFEIMDGERLGFPCDPFSPEALAAALARVWALSDAEADSLRERADEACRSRYSEATIGPQLARAFE